MSSRPPRSRLWLHIALSVLTLGLWFGGLLTYRFWGQGNRRAAAWSAGATAILLLVIGFAAGGSDDESTDAAPEATTEAATTQAEHTATTTPPALSAPPTTATAPVEDELRAFGATRETWYANHEPAPDPELAEGCCFEPLLANGRPSIYAAFWDDDRIASYSLRFEEPMPLAVGRQTVVEHAPVGAKLVFDKVKDTCRMIQYAHPALEAALGAGQAMTAALYSNDLGEPYDGRVLKIIFTALPKDDSSFGC
jgi:hypothetical protein